MNKRKTGYRLAALAALLVMLATLLMSCGGGATVGSDMKQVTTEAKNLDELSEEDLAGLKELEEQYMEKSKTSSAIEGIGDILEVPFGYLMQFCSVITGHIYVLALLLFTIAMKLLLLPFGIKQQKSMIKTAMFAPRQKAIQAKYAGRTDKATMQQMQQELMEAQKEAGVSTFGGCLPLLIQFPILICLYSVIQYPLRYIAHLSSANVSALQVRALSLGSEKLGDIATTASTLLGGGKSLTDVASSVNQIKLIPVIRENFAHFADLFEGSGITSADKLPSFRFFGLNPDLSGTPSISPLNWLIVIPVLVFFAYFFSMKLTRKFSYQQPTVEGQPDAAKSMKIMDYMMPLFSVYICFNVPAGLAIYWIYSSILGVVQQYLLTKAYPFPTFTEEEYKEAQRIYNGKAAKRKPLAAPDPNRPKVRSLHHIDDDDEDELPESLRNAPVSSRYGDEDEPDPPKSTPVEKAKLKSDKKSDKKDS